ncbi:hypothetical protein [Nocardia bovistercoris]|uniref:Integral membrane protein n=1 Tax=Nocardia bovistercoris TaxID=2785916 RepID=A0A931IKA3_9NOCA|nr:hypothetical protein [Nocardia bovistercoris]MBH0781577.1 hypothetical protein [Nocardia bovistercoris]
MDSLNRFESKTTHRLIRLEYGVGLAVSLALFALHLDEVRWLPAIFLFAYIDVIGYLPGLIAHHRSEDGEVARVYYVLYNVMHSVTTQSVVVGLWLLVYGFEWALLVVPIHLCGDRALFGNFMRTFYAPFEPKKLPAFAEFERTLTDRTARGAETLERI